MTTSTIDYIITYEPPLSDQVAHALSTYSVHASKLEPLLYVRVEKSRERALLEELATVPNITYRQALERRALEKPRA